MPTVPAKCRRVSGSPFQYRILFIVDTDGRSGVRLEPAEFIHTFGDAHLYLNHLAQARLQLGRGPRSLPRMTLNPRVDSIFDFSFDDFTLEGYDPHPHIKAPIAV